MAISQERRITQLLNSLAEKRDYVNQLQGERKSLLGQLEALGSKTVEQAEKEIARLEGKVKTETAELSRLMERLEKDWEWE